MSSVVRSSLFHKKSKSSLRSTETEDRKSIRKQSICSISASETSRRHKLDSLNPLSLHPPLSLNASPQATEYDLARYEEDEERETRFFRQTQYANDHIQGLSEFSPIKGENCYFDGARTRHYAEEEEWPLKNNWSGTSSLASSATASPTEAAIPKRRNADWANDRDVFIKRGAWKRQGIVFGLQEKDEEWQEQHFELPLPDYAI
ncbi:hypothetical protein GGS21DRAFT_143913 [Xylaria nigripes]|nr:hypothetical protein GGS21DRAFT_143913 [Xylaria nigripes]